MNPSFTETQKFNKWWHYLIAGFPVISTTVIFFLVQSGIVQTKNNQKEPLFFILTISYALFTASSHKLIDLWIWFFLFCFWLLFGFYI